MKYSVNVVPVLIFGGVIVGLALVKRFLPEFYEEAVRLGVTVMAVTRQIGQAEPAPKPFTLWKRDDPDNDSGEDTKP